MKLLLTLLIICSRLTGISQTIPWFFDSPVFQDWVVQNKVRCLKYETPIPVGEAIKRYGYYESFDSKRPKNRYEITDYPIDRIVHEFYFDKTGLIDSFASKVLTIHFYVNDSSYNYPSAISPSGGIPRKLSESGLPKPKAYPSKTVLKDFKVLFMEYFIGPDGTVWYDSPGTMSVFTGDVKDRYRYQLTQTVNFEKGKPVEALNVLYTGDSWTAWYQHAKVEMIGDSLEVLRRHKTYHNPDTFEEYNKLNDKDTVFTEGNYYRIDHKKGLKEFGKKVNGDFLVSWSILEKSNTFKRTVYYENYPFYIDFTSPLRNGCDLLQFSEGPENYTHWTDNPGFYHIDRLFQPRHFRDAIELIEKIKNGKVVQSKVYAVSQNKKVLLYEELKTPNGIKRVSGLNNRWNYKEIDFQIIQNEFRVSFSEKNNHTNETDTTLWLWTNGNQLNYVDFLDKNDPVYQLQIVKW